jgi:hypothetical protein
VTWPIFNTISSIFTHFSDNCTKTSMISAIGSIIGRMALPASEDATFKWLKHNTALGELLQVFSYEPDKTLLYLRGFMQTLRRRPVLADVQRGIKQPDSAAWGAPRCRSKNHYEG